MSFHHRLPALITGLLSSAAVLSAAFAGSSCRFLVFAREDIESSFGVLCEHDWFPREGDNMWELSRIFLIVGLSLGSLTAALAWSVASFLRPSNLNWNGVSVLAAVTAVVQVPIFVLFEAAPCFEEAPEDESFFFQTGKSTCALGSGSYALMVSILLYIGVVLVTQCLDRPRWRLELDLWKVKSRVSVPRNDDYYYDENQNYDDHVCLTGPNTSRDEETGLYQKSDDVEGKPGFFSRLLQKPKEENDDDDREVPAVETHSMSEESDGDSVPLNSFSYAAGGETTSVQEEEGHEITLEETQGHEIALEETQLEREPLVHSAPPLARETILVSSTTVEHHQMIESPDVSREEPVVLSSTPAVERHQWIESPDVSRENSFQAKHQPPVVTASVDDILQDLHSEEVSASTEQGIVRKLLKKDSSKKQRSKPKAKRGLFSNTRKSGYAQIDDDYESSDNDNSDAFPMENYGNASSVPLFSPVVVKETAPEENRPNETMDDFDEDSSEDEISLLASKRDWHEDFDGDLASDPTNPFDTLSIGSTHSDPGPISVVDNNEQPFDVSNPIITTGRDGTNTLEDIFKFHSEEDDTQLWEPEFPNEALPAFTDDSSEDSSSRGRGRSLGRDPRRRRRAISPVESIKSHCSLLHTTIDEETQEDVENELGLYDRYKIKRTFSCPESRMPPTHKARKEKSTQDLLKRLAQLKQTIDTEMDPNSNLDDSQREYVDRSRELPPLPPQKPKTSETAQTEDPEVEAEEPTKAPEAKADEPSNYNEEPTRSPVAWKEPELPTLKKVWKEDGVRKTPSKEVFKIDLPDTPNTMDMSDETSDTGHTRSTISDSSDDDDSTGPRRIRSKSMGRVRTPKKSLSPTRRRRSSSLSDRMRGTTSNISSLARESRIRRLQLRKGYLPLDNDRAQSPPRGRFTNPEEDDPELTPKRKTVVVTANDSFEHSPTRTADDDSADDLFHTTLLDPDESCPEFDNILNQLDLELIDLNRPMGAEYGDDEGSL